MVYMGWIHLYSLLLSLFIISLAWNTTYWIKEKDNQLLAFILSIYVYHFILQSINISADEMGDNVLLYFLYHTINGVIFNYSYIFTLLTLLCLALLFIKVMKIKKS